jgi:ABC-type bacteriocin/lantibiotic exporter with double-glycine peptidase domain
MGNAKGFKRPAPRVVQQKGNESCWAAALESWLDAIGEPQRRRTQAELLKDRKEEGIKVPEFRNLVAGFGMDTKMVQGAGEFIADRIEERLRNSSVLLVAYETEDHSFWWHDVVLYAVTIPAKDEPAYSVMDPAKKGGYDTFYKVRFFPAGPDEPVILGWQARGRPGKQW